MFPQLYTAASGIVAGEQTLDLVTSNLANARTPAFRPDRPVFATYLSEAAAAASSPSGRADAPREVMLAAAWRGEEQGPITETGGPFDLALQGPGWFRVATPNGERLTRAGAFSRAADGRLVTQHGHSVLDTNGRPIVLPEGRIAVAPDGSVTVGEAPAGRIGLAQAVAATLKREGEMLWIPADGAVVPLAGDGTAIRQGYLEQSGVNATSELVSMIEAQRLYEMHQKLVDVTANTLARKAIELGEVR